MPKGGNCAFSLVAIILCGYLMNWGYSLIVSLVCLGLHFALGLATFYGPLSVIFDYLLPIVLIGLTPLIPLLKVGKYGACWNYRNGCFKNNLSFDFRMVCFPNTVQEANLTYNLPYNIATIIACFILFVILYPRLKQFIYKTRFESFFTERKITDLYNVNVNKGVVCCGRYCRKENLNTWI